MMTPEDKLMQRLAQTLGHTDPFEKIASDQANTTEDVETTEESFELPEMFTALEKEATVLDLGVEGAFDHPAFQDGFYSAMNKHAGAIHEAIEKCAAEGMMSRINKGMSGSPMKGAAIGAGVGAAANLVRTHLNNSGRAPEQRQSLIGGAAKGAVAGGAVGGLAGAGSKLMGNDDRVARRLGKAKAERADRTRRRDNRIARRGRKPENTK